MEGKNELFRKLKPPCVALGQAALALNGAHGSVHVATEHLESVRRILSSATSGLRYALDSKLAEYVFFPIAQLLRVSQKLSIRSLEICLQCIAILIDRGWRQHMPPKLAAQITILCSLLGERTPKGLSFSETTDELQASSFLCLYHVFSVAIENGETKSLLTSESNFPQLGQTVSVILDGILDGSSAEVQSAAASALEALMSNVADREIHASFLPGIVSKLTRVLTPQTKQRRDYKVIIGCLETLNMLIGSIMGDERLQNVTNRIDGGLTNQHRNTSIVDSKWQESAASQLKPAFSNIFRLKAHARDDVKQALARLCLTLLRDCRKTLGNCSRMALEALVTISGSQAMATVAGELTNLIRYDSAAEALLQNLLYDWLQSLTTVLQGSDEQAKISRMEQIRTAYQLMIENEVGRAAIDRVFATTLRDSVVVTIAVPNTKQQTASFSSPVQSLDLKILDGESISTEYASPLVKYRGQEEILSSLERLAKLVCSSPSTSNFSADTARLLQHSQGETQVASFWMLLTAIETAMEETKDVDDLLNFRDLPRSTHNEYLEEIYSFSLATLTSSSEETTDPRLQALALRGLALRARVAGQDFRYELVDALYPVLHTLATPDEQLQRDGFTTLNVFTSACGYSSVQKLIVENVDYLTNAVALKLNAFDVSPQAPQVLLMMVRLAGSKLLPYLEDTVESIFAALEDFHGYPILVELLFKVLGVIAEEGVKAPQLSITDGDANTRDLVLDDEWTPTGIDSLASALRQRAVDETNDLGNEMQNVEPHPQKPWGKAGDSGTDEGNDEAHNVDSQDQQMEEVDPSPPAPRTYSLLFKIAELTQHFLPAASPSLRTSLLALIRTTVPAIALHENSFLPLINTLWPEVVSRVDDAEPQIVATALEIIGLLCEYAGDFMRSRILQLWPRLLEVYKEAAKAVVQSNSFRNEDFYGHEDHATALVPSAQFRNAVSQMEAAPANYGDTSTRILWCALINTTTSLVRYVHLPPEIFDEALEMAEPVLEHTHVQFAFQKENADAFWLAAVKSRIFARPEIPSVPENVEWQFAKVPG